MATAPRVFRPESFADVEEFAIRVRGGSVVDLVLDQTSTDNELRLIDFASGLVLGVSGTMQRVGPRHFRLTNPWSSPGGDPSGDREPRSPRPFPGMSAAALTQEPAFVEIPIPR